MSRELINLYNQQMGLLNKTIESLQETQSIELDRFDGLILTKKDIELYLFSMSKGPKRYVMIYDTASITVIRMVDHVDVSQVYKLITPDDGIPMRGPKEFLCGQLNKYLMSDWVQTRKVCKLINAKMFADKVIPYSWMQRNTSSAPIFKRMGRPTEVLQKTIGDLIEEGILLYIDTNIYNTGAKLYKINMQPYGVK